MQRRFSQIRFTSRKWISFVVLAGTIGLLLCQKSHGWGWHSIVLDRLRGSPHGPVLAQFLALACAGYLIWIVRGQNARILTFAFLLLLAIYCSWFAELRFNVLAVTLIVPVFLASWLVVTNAPGPLRDLSDGNEERAGLLLAATLSMTFWTVFQGFFIQDVDFAFGMKHLDETASEGRLFLLLYPFTLLKYGLPLVLTVFIYVALRGLENSRRVVIAALIFCNFKLAALLVQIFVGPFGSHQKLYELAMSDFVFVSQVLLLLAFGYMSILACAMIVRRFAKAPAEIIPKFGEVAPIVIK